MTRREWIALTGAAAMLPGQEGVYRQGKRRELFLDEERVLERRGVKLRLGTPVSRGCAFRLDLPWEGAFSGYTTLLAEGERVRAYYRGLPTAGKDESDQAVVCVAESLDGGLNWRKPEMRLFPAEGGRATNLVLRGMAPFAHNFSPMIDPTGRGGMRYKALAGLSGSGLVAFGSEDGWRWKKLREEPVLRAPSAGAFDSQNQAFWSEAEGRYVMYFRTWKKVAGTNYRWISRATSEDFLEWKVEGEMDFGAGEPEHLYTNQTAPYYRAPEFYVGLCARFVPGRAALDAEEAKRIGVDARYYGDVSDAVMISSRGGRRYQRRFREAFLRPGLGLENWTSRTNYPALNIVPRGEEAMSFYVNRHYGQPKACLERYDLRVDGLASAWAGASGGELVTKPLVMDGSTLEVNLATSARGGLRVELQDAQGAAIEGYTLAESVEIFGDRVAMECRWKQGSWKQGRDLAAWRGKALRVRFVLRDADLYSYCFR